MTDYAPEIIAASRAHGLDPLLVEAVVLQESSGKAHAVRFEPSVARWFKGNPKAAGLTPERYASSYGLMQILYATATDYGFSSAPEFLFLPQVGLDFGCMHLAAMLKWAQKDTMLALAAYNGGKGNAHEAQPMRYAAQVLRRLDELKA
jgi:soluble lytic murein transglycosylase-like protein